MNITSAAFRFTVVLFLLGLNIINAFGQVTARAAFARVDSVIGILSPDAELCGGRASVDTLGRSAEWALLYMNQDSAYYLRFAEGKVFLDSVGGLRYGMSMIVDSPWIDSDAALRVAEETQGRRIRTSFLLCSIEARLAQPLAPPFSVFWQFDYVCVDSTRWIRIDAISGGVLTSLDQRVDPIPRGRPSLEHNYPNPFNALTTFSIQLPVAGHVALRIYDVLGRELQTLVDNEMPAGTHGVYWNARHLPSGTYFCRLVSGAHHESKKVILQK